MKRMRKTQVSGKKLFYMPPVSISVVDVLKKLEKHRRHYDAKRLKTGALYASIADWLKHREEKFIMVDLPDHITDEPVLFTWEKTTLKRGVCNYHELLITPRYVLRPVWNLEKRTCDVAVLDETSIVGHGRRFPDFGQCLALDLSCLMWRIHNNPHK